MESLLTLDKKNNYTLFFNSFGGQPDAFNTHTNFKVIKTNYPNKLLNLGLKLGLVKMENLVGEQDWLFLPNLNQFCISPKTKLAITVHDLSPVLTPEFYDIKRRIWHKFLNYKKAFARANIIFAVSEYTKLDLIRLFNVSENKIKVIYPGIDKKIYQNNISESQLRQVRNMYALPGNYFLFLNTLEPRKNLLGLLQAFEIADISSNLVIAGRKGWKYKKMFGAIKKSKKRAKIKYLDYVPLEHKPSIIKMAKALVYPSFYEGFGFQPLEAMAVGTPVIASQITSIPEIVSNAGLLVNPYSNSDMARALEEVEKSIFFRETLAEKGLERVKIFSWQNTARGILEALNTK